MPRNAVAFEAANEADLHKPGAYRFMYYPHNKAQNRVACGIEHGCPCGCGMLSAMWFEGQPNAGGPKWTVQGEWPKVTLAPSIGINPKDAQGRYHWHGFLEDGVWVER